MPRQDDITTLLYAELLSLCANKLPSERGVSIVSKMVGGRRYWYAQLTVGSKQKQYSIGPDTAEVRDRIEAHKVLIEKGSERAETGQRLVAMLAKGGAITPMNAEARVLEVLERAGVFLVGGVLVGSHAFSVYGNMLGVRWEREAFMTQDIDIASDHRIEVAIPEHVADLKTALMESGMGFVEVPAFDRKNPSTSFTVQGQALKVDLLISMKGKESHKPVQIRKLKTFAAPVRFMDYLLEDVQPAAVVAKAGMLVNVADPARFALHKLVVAHRRPVAMQTKVLKDIQQAGVLLEVLLEDRPGDILLAAEAAKFMPQKFQSELLLGVNKLDTGLRKQVTRTLSSALEVSPPI